VPGQLVSPGVVEFMRRLDVKEVHGYRRDLGLAVFTSEALERLAPGAAEWPRALAHETAHGLH
jgi:arginine decarboxylase